MTIPIYDTTTLPRISFPMRNAQDESMKYQGGRAVTGKVTAEVNLIAINDAQIDALYDFWRTSCNYGLEPFLIPIPLFGRTVSLDMPDLLVKFVGKINTNKKKGIWDAKFKIKVFGTIDYIIDDLGNFIVSDTGEYVVTDEGDYMPTGNVINSYREVLYA